MSESTLDLHAIQLALVELRAQVQAQQSRTAETIEGLLEVVRETRNEVAGVSRRLDDVTRLQTSHEAQNEAIGRAFKAIKELADSTKENFTSRDTEHKKTRDKVIWFSGAAAMLSLLASTCVGLVMYYTGQIDSDKDHERARLEQTVQDHDTRIRTLETYVPRTYPDTHP